MKKISLAMAFVVAALGSLTAQTNLQSGIKLLENENYAAAQKFFSDVVAKEPTNAEAFYWLGETYYQNRDTSNLKEYKSSNLPKAKENYEKGLVANGKNSACLAGAGKIMLDNGNKAEAEKLFDKAIKSAKKKELANANYMVGTSLLTSLNSNSASAAKYFEAARDLNPQVAKYWVGMGDAKRATRDNGGAMSAYESGFEKDKTDPEVLLKMGQIWGAAQQYNNAIQRTEEALKLNPDYALAYKDLIEYFMATKQYSKVTPTLEKYVKLAGTDIDARVRFVKFLCYQAKDYDRSLAEAEKVLKEDPKRTVMYRWIGWAQTEKGNYKEAVAAFNELFAKMPADQIFPSDYDRYARSAAKSGSLEDGIAAYKKIAATDASRACAAYDEITKLVAEAKKEDYKAIYDAYADKSKNCASTTATDYYYMMSYGYYAKLYKEAGEAADKYVEKDAKSPDGYYFKALCVNELDEANAFLAKPYYEKVVEVAGEKVIDRNKTFLKKAYNYLGIYEGAKQNLEGAKAFFQKTIAIDPTDKTANSYLNQLNGMGAEQPAPATGGGK